MTYIISYLSIFFDFQSFLFRGFCIDDKSFKVISNSLISDFVPGNLWSVIPPNTRGKVQNSISSHAKYSNYFKFPFLPRPIVLKLSQKYQWAKILLPLKPILRCPKSSNPNLSIATTEGSDHIPPAGKRCLLGVSRVSYIIPISGVYVFRVAVPIGKYSCSMLFHVFFALDAAQS